MMTLQLTDDQVQIMVEALEMYNDCKNDTMFDDIDMDAEATAETRAKIIKAYSQQLKIQHMVRMFGGDIDDKGYCTF